MNYTILYMDDSLLAVDKPAGLPTLPDGYQRDAPYLIGMLEAQFKRVWVVHRLDRYTSGVVVVARSAAAHRDLNTQFETRRVSKAYHALVVGNPAWVDRVVDLPLRADGDRKHRTVIDPARGKAAVTNLHVLERFQQYTLIEAKPETGRTHQIRAHLAAQGLPIVADALYGKGQGIAGLDRLGLHARSLTIEHPMTREVMTFEAPYPADFAVALRYLRGKLDADPGTPSPLR